MNLHIIVDDEVIDIAYRVFEETSPGNNLFLLVEGKKNIAYSIKKTPIEVVSKQTFLSENFTKTLIKFDMIIIHSMNNLNLNFITKIPINIKLVWIGWGFDYYDLITKGDENRLLLPLTKALFDKNTNRYFQKISQKMKILVKSIIINKKNCKSEVINRVDFFSPVLYEDYELVKKSLPNFTPKYIPWNYGTLEDDMIRGFEETTIKGNNILLGNSASYQNNHLDIFRLLSTIDIQNRKIISPLSYGDPLYRDTIINCGKTYWGDQFDPVVDWMSIDTYINLISTCSVVIMNHLRQQALGNTIIMMHLGAKIFLNKESPVYHFLKKEGAYIFSIEELESEINTRLNDSQVNHNRCILRRHFSRDTILKKTRNLLNA